MTTIKCEKCGTDYKTKNPNLIPHWCGPCDKAEGKKQLEFHHRNYGAPKARSMAQKRMEPF